MSSGEPITKAKGAGPRQPYAVMRRLTIRDSLSLAFGVLLGLTLLICLLAWLLYDELGSDLEVMSTELVPEVVQSRNLAIANSGFATLAGKIAQAETPAELARQFEFGQLASARLDQALDVAGGLFNAGQLQMLRQINRQISDSLEQLTQAVNQRFELQAALTQKKKQISQALAVAFEQIEQSVVALAGKGASAQVQLSLQEIDLIREAGWRLNAATGFKSQEDLEGLVDDFSRLNKLRQELFPQLEKAGLENHLLQALQGSGWNQGDFLRLQTDLLEIESNIKTLVASSSQLSAQFRLLTTVVVKRSSEQVESLRREALEEIASRKQLMVIAVTFCLGVAVVLVWYFGHRRMARPLELLSHAVHSFERGEEGVVMSQAGVREIQDLSETFKRMAETLSKRDHELQRLHLLLRNVVDSLAPVLLAVDQNCALKLWNLQAEKVCDRKALTVGQSAIAALDWLPLKTEQLERAVENGESLLLKNLRVERGDEQRVYELSCNPLIDTHSPGAVLRIEDVTERLRFEKALAQSEKLLSVGSLAAGVAHEINNPLAGIMQYTQVLGNRLNPSLPSNAKIAAECGFTMSALEVYLEQRGIKKMLDGIRCSANQAAKIVNKMLALRRSSSIVDELNYEQVDMVALLEDTLALMSSDYDLRHGYDFRKIEIRRNLADSLPRICCEPSLIQQVLFNVLKNCAQMFGQEEIERTDACISLTLQQDGEQLKLSIRDNGPGMSEEALQRIFEPFFTTKDVGRGAGLGMSVVYFIVNDFHRGHIEVDSAPGKGSCFDIWLPLEQPVPELVE